MFERTTVKNVFPALCVYQYIETLMDTVDLIYGS